jgi:hypothetical protein
LLSILEVSLERSFWTFSQSSFSKKEKSKAGGKKSQEKRKKVKMSN